MVFHPTHSDTYFVCLLTSYGIPSEKVANEAAAVERMLNAARQREDYLGNDYSQSVDSRIFLTYWKTEAAMVKWKETLEYGQWAYIEHVHDVNQDATKPKSYHIHLLSHYGSTEPEETSATKPPPTISPARRKSPPTSSLLSGLPPVYEQDDEDKSTPEQLRSFEDFAQSLSPSLEEDSGQDSRPHKPHVPMSKNIFAGNIEDDHCSKSKEEVAVEDETSLFDYVTEVEETPQKRKKRSREENPFAVLKKDERLQYKVTVLMAMHSRRGNNRTEFSCPPPESNVMAIGFFWEHFPACEKILGEFAGEYFTACYRKLPTGAMRRLNDRILERVHLAIAKNRYEVDPEFDDRKLRERIRCYYKTLIANAKKRLATMTKNKDNEENQAYLQIFLRCARDPNLSLRRSVEMASANHDFKRRWMGKIDQLRHQIWEK